MSESVHTGPLPEAYYLQNFLTLLAVVQGRCGDLLSADELDWIEAIQLCSESSRRLYVRLLMRRRRLFRLDRLAYREIVDIAACSNDLVRAGLASDRAPDHLAELLSAFTLPELKELFDSDAAQSRSRAALVTEIVKRERPADVHRLQRAAQWICVLGHEHLAVVRLCFFGNLHQDFSEFVRTDLGNARYEPYTIPPGSRAFRDRREVEAHLQMYELAALFDVADKRSSEALLAIARRVPEPIDSDGRLQRRRDRLLDRIARALERLGEIHSALEMYDLTQLPAARGQRLRLQLRGDRLEETTLGVSHRPLTKPFRPASSRLVLRRGEHRVERTAQQFYGRFGECFEVENALFTGVLGLFIWDILYLPVPGAFCHPFQVGPLDFHEPEFRQRRAEPLARRFRELNDRSRFRRRVLERFDDRHGVLNPLVRWSRLSRSLLELALDRIDTTHWSVIFERLLDNPAEHATGLPDLILFPHGGGFELIEIKGPGDALQTNQRRWLATFDRHGIPARVVKIRWARCLDEERCS